MIMKDLGRLEFYATCREPGLAVCVATGDNRLYANILLTIDTSRRRPDDPPPAGTTDHDREQFWALFVPNRSRS